MSESKTNQDKWRAEAQREERKARLAGMKSKDGGKKPVRTSNKLATLITVLVVVVALIGAGIWWVFSIGLPQRTVSALTIGSEQVTAAEFNYYYYSQLSYYSIDPTTAEGQTTLNSPYNETYPTVADYVKDLSAKEIQRSVLLTQAAAAAGVGLDEADKTQIESYMTNIKNSAASAGKTVENFLISSYGKGMNEAVIRKILERYVLSDKYSTQLQDSYVFTETDILNYYNDNKDDFDLVSYRSFYIAADIKTGATDEEKKTALAAAKAKADEMNGKISSEADFKEMCIKYAADETEEKKYIDSDASLKEDTLKSSIYNEDQSKWLFDAARKAGDKTVLESTSGSYVFYFVGREQNTTAQVSVRHILIAADREKASEADIATAKTKAEQILNQYLAGAKTEDAFAALVADNTEDPGSAATGGLYSNITPTSSYVEEFLAWAVDKNRKPGDTGIVQTDFGFHIMYFVGIDGIQWKIDVKNSLISDKYNAWLEEQVKAKPFTLDKFGMRFVG